MPSLRASGTMCHASPEVQSRLCSPRMGGGSPLLPTLTGSGTFRNPCFAPPSSLPGPLQTPSAFWLAFGPSLKSAVDSGQTKTFLVTSRPSFLKEDSLPAPSLCLQLHKRPQPAEGQRPTVTYPALQDYFRKRGDSRELTSSWRLPLLCPGCTAPGVRARTRRDGLAQGLGGGTFGEMPRARPASSSLRPASSSLSPGTAQANWGMAAGRGGQGALLQLHLPPSEVLSSPPSSPVGNQQDQLLPRLGKERLQARAIIYSTTCLNDCPKSLPD